MRLAIIHHRWLDGLAGCHDLLHSFLFVCHVKSILRCHLQAFRVFICQRKGLFERTYPCNYIVLTFLDRSPFVEMQPLKDVTGLKM